ncbi:PREDICTED: ras-related protein Rab-18-like [Elephantulus edwardii]|uniref:ras-related protein Rab-18-like n=1 Tax=Elephantulus edwardii TaxID=28737 RepID=UPI0003F0EB24|nr:PREDICTED: ras-related protein Rab-18-like [Elephantulus edwardii]
MDDDMLTTLKILVIGESEVGKSRLFLSFTDDTFDLELAAITGVDFKVKTISESRKNAELALWDTAGQERNSWAKFAWKLSILFTEVSAETCVGVQCAFEALAEKNIQTPELWESKNQNEGVKLSYREEGHRGGACGGYILFYKLWEMPSLAYLL